MTPNDIEILIHCHCSPVRHPRWHAPAVSESLNSMERNGLIVQVSDGIYKTTDRGRAHLHQLCTLPWPVKKWVDYKGNEIIED